MTSLHETRAPALHTARLDLESLDPVLAGEAWPLVNDERMWRFFPALRPSSAEHLRAIYERRVRGPDDRAQRWENWACRNRSTGALIGEMQATIFPVQRLAYLAYAVYHAHQRRGYAREAAQAVIERLRNAYRVERVIAEMDVRNEASRRLAESLGFRRVETRLASGRESDSPFGEEYLYELKPS